jgi:hypothetical protein
LHCCLHARHAPTWSHVPTCLSIETARTTRSAARTICPEPLPPLPTDKRGDKPHVEPDKGRPKSATKQKEPVRKKLLFSSRLGRGRFGGVIHMYYVVLSRASTSRSLETVGQHGRITITGVTCLQYVLPKLTQSQIHCVFPFRLDNEPLGGQLWHGYPAAMNSNWCG